MFKLTKYEFRKNITAPAILLAVILCLEVLFLGSVTFKPEGFTGVLFFSLLIIVMFFSFFLVSIFGIVSYSKELRSKSSYMTFLAPVSPYQVIGSKLLSVLIVAAGFAAVFFVLLPTNYMVMEMTYSEVGNIVDAFKTLLEFFDYSLTTIIINIVMVIGELMVSFYYVVVLAYFAISLSSTVFQDKKYKWVVTTVIFVVLYGTTTYIGNQIPEIGDPTTLREAFIAELPKLSYMIALIIGGYIGSAVLLEKKISL